MVMQIRRTLFLTVRAAVLCCWFSLPSWAATVEDIALLKSANREKILIEGAKKEGKMSLYTGLIVDQVVRPVKDAFEKEYPFLQLEFFRANAERLAQRMLAEYQAKRYEVDVISGSAAATILQRAGLMQRFYSPPIAEYPPELKDAKGFWGSTNVYFMTLGYNTRAVKASELPKTYEDLLNPRWKGQMMWSTSRGSGAPQFIGNILLTMGQEQGKAYLRKLKAQSVAKSTASARQILDLVIAGEYPMAIQIFNHHAYISKAAGAPVEWRPIDPVVANVGYSGIVARAPRPHAALLFIDYLHSKEGQQFIVKGGLSSPRDDVESLLPQKFKKTYLEAKYSLDEYEKKLEEWEDLIQMLFIKKR